MGLRKKTFLYSIMLAVILIAFVIGYFILMLPSLYVDYVMDSNLHSVMEIQQSYMENRTYEDLKVRNPTAVFTIVVPDEGDEIYMEGKFFKLTVRVQDEELQKILDSVRAAMRRGENFDLGDMIQHDRPKQSDAGAEQNGIGHRSLEDAANDMNLEGIDFSQLESLWNGGLKQKFTGQNMISADYPIEAELERHPASDTVYRGEYYKVHSVSEQIVVYESGVSDGDYSYTSYMAMGWAEDAFIMTLMPTMTPQMEEITPVVRGSLPMIIAVIFLTVLISSRFFSGKIVSPIIRLADSAENAAIAGNFEADGFVIDSGDEIGILGRNLHELYHKLHENYEELERKNRILEEENERQEVFLRASSHQLKTPVAAALLLVEGMMNEVGKYKDTKAYLPEVKRQLLSMRKIIEDILYLNHCADRMQTENIDLRGVVQELVKSYLIQAESRGLCIDMKGRGTVTADREMLRIIVDNLLSNAVQYTPDEQRILVSVDNEGIVITNYGVTIEEKLLPNIFEPFVSSDMSRKGKGLGLYVASYYCRRMGYRIEIRNIENGVQAKVVFREKGGEPACC